MACVRGHTLRPVCSYRAVGIADWESGGKASRLHLLCLVCSEMYQAGCTVVDVPSDKLNSLSELASLQMNISARSCWSTLRCWSLKIAEWCLELSWILAESCGITDSIPK